MVDLLQRRPLFEQLEDRRLLAITPPWHNVIEPTDVNGDGLTSPIDALLVINYLNGEGAGAVPQSGQVPPPFLDVNADNFVAPLDVLLVINLLNQRSSGEGEGWFSYSSTIPPDASNACATTFEYEAPPTHLIAESNELRESIQVAFSSLVSQLRTRPYSESIAKTEFLENPLLHDCYFDLFEEEI